MKLDFKIIKIKTLFVLLLNLIVALQNTIGATVGDTILVSNVQRNFIVHTPPGYPSKQYPVILCFHGVTSDAAQQETISNFDSIADTANFIVVYPNGYHKQWNVPNKNSLPNDSAFIADLITYLISNYSANPNRIYACGYSEGALLCYNLLAVQFQSRIAAISGVEANTLDSTKAKYGSTARSMPILDFNGTGDSISKYNGDPTGGSIATTSVPQSCLWWATINKCNLTPLQTYLPNPVLSDSCTEEEYYYSPGQDSAEVILVKINNGGHTWPGSTFNFGKLLGNVCKDFGASVWMWNFFNQHQLLLSTISIQNTKSGVSFSLYPNPSNGNVTINLNEQIIEFFFLNIFDITGKRIISQCTYQGRSTVDASSLSEGVYNVCITNIGTGERTNRRLVIVR